MTGISNHRTILCDPLVFVGFLRKLLLPVLWALILLQATSGAPGDLDLTFGGSGKLITSFGSGSDYATDLAIQLDGKIIAIGRTSTGFDFAIVRYNIDGSLDLSFGANGKVITSIGADDEANAVVIQPDGKIVVVGSSTINSTWDFAMVRYNTDGSLDSTFGSGGIVTTPIGVGQDNALAVALQSDGKLVVSGSSLVGATFDFAIARYNPNGTIDASFDVDGKTTVSIGNGVDRSNSVAIQSDGKIVAAGTSDNGTNSDFALVRLNSNGSLDTSFNGSGKVTSQFGNGPDSCEDIAIQADNKIVAVGNSRINDTPPSNVDFALIRYNTNGSLDSTFDGDGKVTTPIGAGDDGAYAVTIQPNGKIIAVGGRFAAGGFSTDFALTRYNANGSMDPSFGNNGIVLTPFGNNEDLAYAVALQQDGKIVAAGRYRSNSTLDVDFAIARYVGNPAGRFFDFDGDSKTDLSIFRPGPGEWWWARSSDGGNSALQFGASTDRLVPVDFTGDGKTDVAFWRPSTGQWFVLRSEDFSFYAFPFGATGDVPVPADFDGDGKADPAVFRESSSTWFINKSSGGTDIFGFGSAGDKTAVADYDGDGKADVAIFRPVGVNGAEWWVRRSSTAVVAALQFGSSTDKAVPGDFTGNGKADIAFWRPSTGFWNVLRSEDLSYFAFPFGTTGDVPVAGDYDGDGKTDAGVFRPSNSTWFIQRSTAGTLIQQFGAAGDVPLPSAFVR